MAKCNFTRLHLLAGKSTFTVYNGKDNWFTFKVDAATGHTYAGASVARTFHVKWFAGRDNTNESAYESLGILNAEPLHFVHLPPVCGHCGKTLRVRQRRDNQQRFYGCPGYPACDYTREYDPRINNAVQALNFALQVIQENIPADKWPEAEVMHVAKCCRCRHPLTTPESIKTLIGPECASRISKTPKRNLFVPDPPTAYEAGF